MTSLLCGGIEIGFVHMTQSDAYLGEGLFILTFLLYVALIFCVISGIKGRK